MEKSKDPASRAMLKVAERHDVSTVWDRFAAQTPNADSANWAPAAATVYKGLAASIRSGGGHVGGLRRLGRYHCGPQPVPGHRRRHRGPFRPCQALAHTLLKSAEGRAPDYPVRDAAKLMAVAHRLGLDTSGRSKAGIAKLVAETAWPTSPKRRRRWPGPPPTSQGRVETFLKYGVVPTGIDAAVSEIMHRTHYGVDADRLIPAGRRQVRAGGFCRLRHGHRPRRHLFGTPNRWSAAPTWGC